MMNDADLVGLSSEQTRRFEEFDQEISQSREGIAAWHRLLDRRRLDRKLGLHPITEFALQDRPDGDAQGSLVKKETEALPAGGEREPFYLRTEAEARGLLLRCIGYLTDAEGTKFAADKGYGARDKMAEWMIQEIKASGGLAYISRHSPYLFGIRLMAAAA
jgi:hypothetical protein